MNTYNSQFVKAMTTGSQVDILYFASLTSCAKVFGLRYEASVKKLMEEGGLAPDGKTFFDEPTDQEVKMIRSGEILLVG